MNARGLSKLYSAGITSPENVANAWRELTRVSPVDPLRDREASLYASMHNLDWREARDILEARRYAVQETMDGRYPSANGGMR